MKKTIGILTAINIIFSFAVVSFAAKTKIIHGISSVTQNQFNYYHENSLTDDKNTLHSLARDIKASLKKNQSSSYSDAMLLLQAQIEEKLSRYRDSVVTLIKHRHLHSKSRNSFNVKSMLGNIIDKKIAKSMRKTLKQISKKTPNTPSSLERTAYFLNTMAGETDNYFYDALIGEFYDFFAKYPDYKRTDKLILSLAKLETKEKNYGAAIMYYRKIAKFYPKSSYIPQSKLMLAGIYADNLKEYNTAISVYQNIADTFPDTKWAARSFENMADIAERQKQYSLAIEVYDKIIKTYSGKEFAYKAMLAKARIYRDEFKHPQDAIRVLKGVNTSFKGNKGVSALMQASEIAGEDLKDYNMQVSIYGVVAGSYPKTSAAPEALYEMAYIYERKLENTSKAIEIYRKIKAKYPGNSFALKAEERINKLSKK